MPIDRFQTVYNTSMTLGTVKIYTGLNQYKYFCNENLVNFSPIFWGRNTNKIYTAVNNFDRYLLSQDFVHHFKITNSLRNTKYSDRIFRVHLQFIWSVLVFIIYYFFFFCLITVLCIKWFKTISIMSRTNISV